LPGLGRVQSRPAADNAFTAPSGRAKALAVLIYLIRGGGSGPCDRWCARIGQIEQGSQNLQLDSNEYRVRANASEMLAKHVVLATSLLEEALRKNPSPEVRSRIARLLSLRTGNGVERERAEKAARILEYITRESKR
jgi:hypothetical protein